MIATTAKTLFLLTGHRPRTIADPMQFFYANTFQSALSRLTALEQRAVKVSAIDLQLNPFSSGLSMHRVAASRDPNFWSARVNRDIRMILHQTVTSMLFAYVDHHDKAYGWAEKRRIDVHPRTGAVQIVEVCELVEKLRVSAPTVPNSEEPYLFRELSEDDFLSVGVPIDWLPSIMIATEGTFLDLTPHLPEEAAEALLTYATSGVLLGRALPSYQVDYKPVLMPCIRRYRGDDDPEPPPFDPPGRSAADAIPDSKSVSADRADEPTMDEILASIRRIIADNSPRSAEDSGPKMHSLAMAPRPAIETNYASSFEHPASRRRFIKIEDINGLDRIFGD